MEKIEIAVKDLYQLLIAECRYGYTRNNHLMPNGAYEHAKKYLPLMLEEDRDFAIHTAKQLCEECISEELTQFSDGLDDENNSREAAFKFIEWLLKFVNNDGDTSDYGTGVTSDTYWVPYNIQNFKDNIAKDDELRYRIFKLNYNSIKEDDYKNPNINPKDIELMVKGKFSKNNVLDYLFRELLNLKDEESITYRRYKAGEDSIKYIFDDRKEVYCIIGGSN